jgi:hypothetical protein
MLRRFSRDPQLLVNLRRVGVDRATATNLIQCVVSLAGAPVPDVTFHGGRGPHTGYCQPPRAIAVATTDEHTIASWERSKRSIWPANGMIRLGDPTSIGTIAHEVGHHYVHAFDRPDTASHGKLWVRRFDYAAAQIAGLVDVPE